MGARARAPPDRVAPPLSGPALGGANLPSFRPATPADLDAVAAIERASFSDPWSRKAFAGLLDNPAVLFTTAHTSGELVGYVVAWFAADESEIANIAVAPAARGQKIGALLLDAALAEAARRGAATTYLEVRESNVAARALYASRGFTELGRRRRYYRHPTEDALVLGRPMPESGADTGVA